MKLHHNITLILCSICTTQFKIWQQIYGKTFCCDVDAYTAAAQWMTESGFGTDPNAQANNNLGGLMLKNKLINYGNLQSFYKSYMYNIKKHWPSACGKKGKEYYTALQSSAEPYDQTFKNPLKSVDNYMKVYSQYEPF